MQKKRTVFAASLMLFSSVSILLLVAVVSDKEEEWGREESSITETVTAVHDIRRGNDAQLINPLLDYQSPSTHDPEFMALQSKIRRVIEHHKKERGVSRVSVYFQMLDTHTWFGIGEDEKYEPGSLLKVPILLAYLKLAEYEKGLLEKTIVYDGSFDFDANLVSQDTILQKGGVYTIEELLSRMVVDSDNVSRNVLAKYLSEEWDAAVVAELIRVNDIIVPPHVYAEGHYMMSPADFSGVFRTLYNATYLTDTYSEYALRLLSQSTFDSGLVQGVPGDVVVANKFGFAGTPSDPRDFEIHDCGIIFFPESPYILCIFTQTDGEIPSYRVIAEISEVAYQFMQNDHIESF